MPYIVPERRRDIEDGDEPRTPGELNYVLTRIVDGYVDLQGLSYQSIGEVVSSFECAKLEFYRRVAVPYEEKKIAANGDVYNDRG